MMPPVVAALLAFLFSETTRITWRRFSTVRGEKYGHGKRQA